MPVDFLSDEQVARYRRFRPEVSVAELEQFFRLDAKALEALAGKRRPATKPGSVQRGVRRKDEAYVPPYDDARELATDAGVVHKTLADAKTSPDLGAPQ
ncbi:hypothetical protein AB0G15_38145 [Streptosporangium sp. NPDC023825]|uniref:hypothetical protein n=1 Tax=Streptosporangium sp. NPDC023825 TaxID=3154909 RepID=UPI003424CF28